MNLFLKPALSFSIKKYGLLRSLYSLLPDSVLYQKNQKLLLTELVYLLSVPGREKQKEIFDH